MLNTIARWVTSRKNISCVLLFALILSLGFTISLGSSPKPGKINKTKSKSEKINFNKSAAQHIQQGQSDEVCPPEISIRKQKGLWCTKNVFTKPVMAVHMSVLPDERVIAWGNKGRPISEGSREQNTYNARQTAVQIWNPNLSVTDPNRIKRFDYLNANLFCGGHSFLPDGKLLVTGGIDNGAFAEGINTAAYFDYTTDQWTALPVMNNKRWYPTNLTLGNGNTLVFAGTIGPNQINSIPQLLEEQPNDNFSWRDLNITNPTLYGIYYSWLHLLSNGRVFVIVNDEQRSGLITFRRTRFLKDLWSHGPQPTDARGAGSSVLYGTDQILTVGGGDLPKFTAETINMNALSPVWGRVGRLGAPGPSDPGIGRRHLNATLLADGKVLVTGGNKGPGFNNNCTVNYVYQAEMWDPNNPGGPGLDFKGETGKWHQLASATQPRLYHSSAVLLPDGRVLTGGTTDEPEQVCPDTLPPDEYEQCKTACPKIKDNYIVEVFYPPYLFDANGNFAMRPVIVNAPSSVSYGQTIEVAVSGANVGLDSQVNLIRLPSVTHSFNQNQGVIKKTLVQVGNNLGFTIPANRNACPPGHYMMFVLNSDGVPSKAKIIQIQ